jgi:flagellar biosynthesis GTPase FlhF
MLLNEKMAVSYVTNGQRVPEDLHWASNQTLLRSLIDSQEDFNKELNINELVTSLSGSDVYA